MSKTLLPISEQLLVTIAATCKTLRAGRSTNLAWRIGRQLAEAEREREQAFVRAEWRQISAHLLRQKISLSPGRLQEYHHFYRLFPQRTDWYPELSWTHYTLLLKLKDTATRNFYLQQAALHHWSTRELRRQIRARSFERWQQQSGTGSGAADAIARLIRETYVLEFVELAGQDHLLERDLEQALLDQLQYFLLELGSGFAFVGRQKRIFTETGKQFFIDLVFYHVQQKCYVLIDLKTGELTHRDIGQMDMYIRLYEDKYRSPTDAPTVGIILCTEKDPSLVRYSMLRDSRQLFASTYVLYLPKMPP